MNSNSGKCLGVAHQGKSDGLAVTQVDRCDQRNDTSLVGNAGAKDKNWTQYRWLSCYWKNTFRLYCFEQ